VGPPGGGRKKRRRFSGGQFSCTCAGARACRPGGRLLWRTRRYGWLWPRNDAPWQEVVFEGDQVDLTKLPIPLHFAVDAAPYITAGQIAARDPLTGVDTTGFHRLMVKGKNRLGVSLHSRRRMHEFHRRAEERGHALPAAITLGIHPLRYMGSMVYAYPPHVRKCPAGRATALPDSCRALDFSWSGWSCAGRRLDQGRGARKPRLASNLRNYWPRGGGAQGQYSKTAQSLRR
jgi:hypothetical protein